MRKPQPRTYAMVGGPFTFLTLCSPGTLPFRIGAFHGYYDHTNTWVDLTARANILAGIPAHIPRDVKRRRAQHGQQM